jgi:thiamine-phosphate diphosphorylase
VLSGADGVHVGQDDMSVHQARQIVGPDRLVGVSTHSIEQARQAVLDGADYLGVGPTFSSTHSPGWTSSAPSPPRLVCPGSQSGGSVLRTSPR